MSLQDAHENYGYEKCSIENEIVYLSEIIGVNDMQIIQNGHTSPHFGLLDKISSNDGLREFDILPPHMQ